MDGFLIPHGRITKAESRKRLISSRGGFDPAALVAWVNDRTCFKAYMPDHSPRAVGIDYGDLLIADPMAEPVPGGLVVLVHEQRFVRVERIVADAAGQACRGASKAKSPPRGLCLPY